MLKRLQRPVLIIPAALLLFVAYFLVNMWQGWFVTFSPTLTIFLPFLLLVGLPLYFLPAIIGRHKYNARAILVLNRLLGWTFLGWDGALIWASTMDRERPEEPVS